MNVFHITYEPNHHVLDLHFWGCNLNCRGCYKVFEPYDLGLKGFSLDDLTKKSRVNPPMNFLSCRDVMAKISELDIRHSIFMGQEAAIDPYLPKLAEDIRKQFNSYNILLTNGLKIPDLDNIDEVIFSFKTFSEEIHREYTGRSNNIILENFSKLAKSAIRLQAEIAFIPGLVENSEIGSLAKFVAGINPDTTFRVTSYFAVPKAPWPSANIDQVTGAADIAGNYLKNTVKITSDMKDNNWNPIRIY